MGPYQESLVQEELPDLKDGEAVGLRHQGSLDIKKQFVYFDIVVLVQKEASSLSF